MGYKHDFIYLKVFVFLHLTFSLSVTKPVNMTLCKCEIRILEFDIHFTVLYMGFKITYAKSR